MIYLKHIRYLLVHKWLVFVGCLKYGLIWQGIIHDWHKLLPDEMIPYAKYIYGGDKTVDIERAVLIHTNRAPHHWDYWVDIKRGKTNPLEMPTKYALEMVADWKAASKAKDNAPAIEWYLQKKTLILLHKETRKIIEKELLQ